MVWVWPILLIFFSAPTSAHPTFVRLGYASCTGCHVSAQGGGLLTPYGQGIASTQAFFAQEPSEDETQRKFLQAFQARLMRYQTTEETRTFPMQIDYLTQYRLTDEWRMDGTLAVAPKPKDQSPEDAAPPHKRLYARVLTLSWVKPFQRVSFGISGLPIGLGLVDHTAFVRSENRNQVTDLPVTLKHYFEHEKWQATHFVYVANPNENAMNKERGVGGQWWFKPERHLAVGLQGLTGESASIQRRLGGILVKAGLGKFAYLGELDRTWRTLKEDHSEFRQWAWYQQFSYYPWDFLHLYTSWQTFERDRAFLTREIRTAVGGEWRVLPRLTVAYEMRKRQAGQTSEDSQLLQLFLNWW